MEGVGKNQYGYSALAAMGCGLTCCAAWCHSRLRQNVSLDCNE